MDIDRGIIDREPKYDNNYIKNIFNRIEFENYYSYFL